MERLTLLAEEIRKRTSCVPEILLVLGSGLGDLADAVREASQVPYGELAGFPVSTVSGHAGRFVFGKLSGVPVMVMQGRVHFYEGYPMRDVVLPVRLAGKLGCKAALLTNAAGGVNPAFAAGSLMAIRDHLLLAPNPLIGANDDALGTRFPDMSSVYDPGLLKALEYAAEKAGVRLEKGVYAQLTGPSYETPAEVRMLGILGADAVGMSTACEAVAARHMGIKVGGVSCITNPAAGISKTPLNHEEVKLAGKNAAAAFAELVLAALPEFSKILSA